MNKDKDLEIMLSQIDRIESLRYIEESLYLMKDIVVNDKKISLENRRKFLIVYFQSLEHLTQQMAKEATLKRKTSLKNRLKNLFR